MSTLVTPATTPAPETPAPLGTVSSFLKTHETLIIALVALGLIFFGYSKYVNYIAARDTAKAQATEQVLQTQVAQNAALATQAQQNVVQYQQLLAQVTAQNQALTKAMAARNTQTQQQQKVDTTLPVPALVSRWTDLAVLPPTAIKPSSDGVDVTVDGAVKTVQQLELLGPLQQNVTDLNTQIVGLNTEITKEGTVVDGLNTEVVGLNKTIVDENANTKAQVAACKATARKSKLKIGAIAFGAGYVAGFVSKLFIK